jgi:hypothetical protein
MSLKEDKAVGTSMRITFDISLATISDGWVLTMHRTLNLMVGAASHLEFLHKATLAYCFRRLNERTFPLTLSVMGGY